eukprot:s3867_g1.t2
MQSRSPTTASASSAKPVDRLVELNSDGSMKTAGAILEGMQMKVGSCVRRRKDKMECEILAIDTGVKLKSLERSEQKSPRARDRRAYVLQSLGRFCKRTNKDGGSLNSEVWDELIAARQEVADRAIEEALKTADADENGPKKNKATRASSKHDFMAPPILTVNYKGHAFRAFTCRSLYRMVMLAASMAGDDEDEMALFIELDLLESFHPMKKGA